MNDKHIRKHRNKYVLSKMFMGKAKTQLFDSIDEARKTLKVWERHVETTKKHIIKEWKQL